MSWQIYIEKAKPNPKGKDTSAGHPLAKQLLGEWVDLKNTGDKRVALNAIYLANRHFDASCRPDKHLTIYWYGPSNVTLAPDQIVRVHTGKRINAALMDAGDQTGVHYHAYAEKGHFILNNSCGDDIGVFWKDGGGQGA